MFVSDLAGQGLENQNDKSNPYPSVLQYRQAMAELVDEVCEENRVAAAGREDIMDLYMPLPDIRELWTPGLLRPPKVDTICADLRIKDGYLDGIIQVNTSEEYGVMNVYITLEDEQGNPIESDYALDNNFMKNYWGYIPSASVRPGTAIVIRAIALDSLGGVGTGTEHIIV